MLIKVAQVHPAVPAKVFEAFNSKVPFIVFAVFWVIVIPPLLVTFQKIILLIVTDAPFAIVAVDVPVTIFPLVLVNDAPVPIEKAAPSVMLFAPALIVKGSLVIIAVFAIEPAPDAAFITKDNVPFVADTVPVLL